MRDFLSGSVAVVLRQKLAVVRRQLLETFFKALMSLFDGTKVGDSHDKGGFA